MRYAPFYTTVIAASIVAASGVTIAQDQAQTRTEQQTQTRTEEQIYGSQLMTQQERNEYQARMRAAKTDQERERIRAEHHTQMQERAKAQGKTLPDSPSPHGGGMGPGGGGGMGPGGGRR
jgi:hypothetical protein